MCVLPVTLNIKACLLTEWWCSFIFLVRTIQQCFTWSQNQTLCMWGFSSETYVYMHCIDTRAHLQKMEEGGRRCSTCRFDWNTGSNNPWHEIAMFLGTSPGRG